MSTIQELREEAEKVTYETRQGGNTAPRIGNLYNGIIDFIDILNDRTENPDEYDDSELREAIRRIDEAIADLDEAIENALALATQERDRLNELIASLDGEIEDKVSDMINDAQWLEEHARNIRELVNEGEIYWKSGWNDNIEAYLQEAGVWAREGDVIKTQWTQLKQSVNEISSTVAEVVENMAGMPTSTQWSNITQKVNSIEASVNKLLYQPDSVEALQSSITQSVADKVARLNLETTYAKLKDMGKVKKIVEWMYSGLRNQTDSDKTFNEIVSAGQSGFNNGISSLHTWVKAFEDKKFIEYEAGASLEAKVGESITGLYSKAVAGQVSSALFAQVLDNKSDIAAIIVNATGDSSEADIATKFSDWKAGLALKAELNSAKSELLASMESKDSASAVILEDMIDQTTANLVAKRNYNAATITAMVNDAGSSIKLNADKIKFDGKTIDLKAEQINFKSGNFQIKRGSTTTFGIDNSGNVTMNGSITATGGKIGGFTIDTDRLYNSNWDAGVDINYDDKSVKIGKNAQGDVNTEQAIIRADNTKSGETYNTALYLNAQNATYNYAFYGNGNGVLNGLMFGYKVQFIDIPAGSADVTKDIILREGSTIILTGTHSSGHVDMRLPSLSEVKYCLGIPSSSKMPFAIEINILNRTNYDYVEICYSKTIGADSAYPIFTDHDNVMHEGWDPQLAVGDYMKIMLVYAKYNNAYYYNGFEIIRNA